MGYLTCDVDVSQPHGDVGFALEKLADMAGRGLQANVKKWMSKRLFGIGNELIRSVERRFKTQSDALGTPWAPLSDMTVSIKRDLGVPEPERILVWTGALRKSFKFKYTTDYSTARVYVYTDVEYAKLMNEGGPASFKEFYTPPRPFGGIDEPAQIYIIEFIQKWMATLIKEEITK